MLFTDSHSTWIVAILPFLSFQISCLSASAALSDRSKYKRYFQLLNSYDTLAYAYFGVIKEYGWKHVELIVQDENLFTEVSQTHWGIEIFVFLLTTCILASRSKF